VPSYSCTPRARATFWNRETTRGSGVDVIFGLFYSRGQVPSTLLKNLLRDSATAFFCPIVVAGGAVHPNPHGPRPLRRTNICHASLFCADAYVLPNRLVFMERKRCAVASRFATRFSCKFYFFFGTLVLQHSPINLACHSDVAVILWPVFPV
jgi:hypothetical protein